jgi:hypothetical protein
MKGYGASSLCLFTKSVALSASGRPPTVVTDHLSKPSGLVNLSAQTMRSLLAIISIGYQRTHPRVADDVETAQRAEMRTQRFWTASRLAEQNTKSWVIESESSESLCDAQFDLRAMKR